MSVAPSDTQRREESLARRKPGAPKAHERGLGAEAARRWDLASVLLRWYLALLALTILAPFVVAPILTSADDVTRIRDLMLSTSAALQGLVGLVGIAVAFYFKGSKSK